MMKYFVKGGARNNGQHGYVFSNAAWDPYPMANEIEAFSNAMANLGVAVTARIYRFDEPFFTVVSPRDVLSAEQRARAAPNGLGYDPTAAWHDLLAYVPPQPPEGIPLGTNVEELQAETALKATRARHVVDDMFQLLGLDLMTSTYWLDIRAIQTPGRKFGAPTEAAWAAFRKAVPWQQDYVDRPARPESGLGYAFVKANAAAQFDPAAAREMDGGRSDGRP
jgi:histidine ammonia-lyase